VVLGLSLATACSTGASAVDAGAVGDVHAVSPAPRPPTDAGHEAAPRDAGSDVQHHVDATDGALDAPADSDAADVPFVTATHVLSTIPDQGGPVLAHPQVVTVTYSNDSNRAFVEDLGAYLVTSPWLSAVGVEYGVGLGTHVNLELPGEAPALISDVEIQGLVESLVESGSAPDSDAGLAVRQLPAEGDSGVVDGGADARADVWDGGGDAAPAVQMPPIIYMMYFPTTTEVTVDGSSLCTVTGGGYHFQTSLSSRGQAFAYAVVTECPSSASTQLVQTTSHELIEAATDPSQGDLAYSISDLLDPWSYFGGEVGDLCSLLAPQWSEGSFTGIQRVYSNKSAATGGDPCLPSPEPYYGNQVEPETAVEVAAGASTMFDITGWSTSPVVAWQLSAELYISYPTTFTPTFTVAGQGPGQFPMLNNGGHTTLTVSIPVGARSGSYALGLVYAARSDGDYTSSLVEVYLP